MESQSENTETSEIPEKPGDLCKECGRSISKKTGACYYCNHEIDKETEKNLSLLLLDWQKDAITDTDERDAQKLRKTLSFFMAVAASACITIGLIPNLDPFHPVYIHWGLGILLAASCWSFYFNSLTVLLSVVVNGGVMIFYINLIIKSIPKMISTAFVSGLVTGLCFFVVFLIVTRIFKTKTVEL